MVIRNRLAALIYRSIISILGIIAIIIGISANIENGFWNSFFAYPTIITLLGTLVIISETIANAIGMKNNINTLAPGVVPMIFHAALSLELSLCAIRIFTSALFGTGFFDGSIINVLLAYIIFPGAYLLDWLLFGEKGTVRWSYGMFPLFIPVFHCILTLMTHYLTGSESYITAILNPELFNGAANLPDVLVAGDGWSGVVITTFIIWLMTLAMDYLLILINNFLAGRYFKQLD